MAYYKRNLPHWHPDGKAIFLTWRLYASLPRKVLATLNTLHADAGKQFLAADSCLDCANSGPHWLRDPKVALCVERALLRGEELGHYLLSTWVIMPNHVHVLLEPRVPLQRLTMGIKRASAKDANVVLGRIGKPFWQDESFDRWVRNSREFERIHLYIEYNPVKARLAKRPEEWRWSSAWNERADA